MLLIELSKQARTASNLGLNILLLMALGCSGCSQYSDNTPNAAPTITTTNNLSTMPVKIDPDDVNIRYIGRVDLSSSSATFDYPNTQIEFRVNAPKIEFLLDDGNNDYNVFVDGQLTTVISTVAGKINYLLVLDNEDHHLLLSKRTGSSSGIGRFLGVSLPNGGRVLSLPAELSHNIEFIGDSYTVGYGNEGPGVDCNNVYRPYENSFMSYASIAARELEAQSHTIAISGKGAVRNYGDPNPISIAPMPTFYNRTLASRPDLSWNFDAWVADAVVIKLGTNDHSTKPNPSTDVFLTGIHDLIEQVITAHKQVPIFLLADNSNSLIVTRMQMAVQQQKNLGNDKIYFVEVTHPPQNQMGCDWHPLVVGHESMAAQLVEAMKPILRW